MELRQLKTFLVLADNLNFTRTAELLGYAQSSVTAQIKLLEEDLGVRLLERLGKSVYLTPAGERFHAYARQILGLAEEAKNAVSDCRSLSGTITIGSVESLCSTRFPKIYKVFHENYPQVEVAVKISHTTELHQWLRDNTVDVGLFIDAKAEATAAEFVCELEIEEPMSVLAAPEHPLTQKPAILPEDLHEEALILTETGCSYRKTLEQILKNAGVKPRSVLESGNIQSIKQLTMSGLGLSFLPRIAAEEELGTGKLAALQWAGPAFCISTQLLYHRDKWLTPIIRAFLQTAGEILAEA